jgi:phospholipase/carboxylesterase
MSAARTPNFTYQHVFEPATSPNSRPLLMLHGTGGNEHDLLRVGRVLSPGGAILSPRGDVNEAGALRFFARLADGSFDPEEVTRRAQGLAEFVTSASRHYGIELARLTAVGFSNGANIAATMLLLRPEILAAAILFRPMVVLDQPAPRESLAGRRVLLTHGSTDPLVPRDHADRLAGLFRAGGADVQLQIIPASHSLTSQDLAAAQSWLEN